MDNKNSNSNGAGNGFLMGVNVGGVGTLLFTTKKGREIVHEMTDKALEKFSELEIALEEKAVELGEVQGNDYLDSTEPIEIEKVKLIREVKPEKSNPVKIAKSETPRTNVKRYFRLKKN